MQTFTLDTFTAEQLIEFLRANRNRIVPELARMTRRATTAGVVHHMAKVTQTVVPADASTGTPGEGQAEIYRLDTGSGQLVKQYRTPQKVKIIVPVPVHDGVWVICHQTPWGDLLIEPDSSVKQFKTPTGGIAAATGGTFGRAECDLQKITLDDGSGDASPSASLDADSVQITMEVHNRSAQSIAGELDIDATLIDGLWMANWEDCG